MMITGQVRFSSFGTPRGLTSGAGTPLAWAWRRADHLIGAGGDAVYVGHRAAQIGGYLSAAAGSSVTLSNRWGVSRGAVIRQRPTAGTCR
jgi:hypothetical protein